VRRLLLAVIVGVVGLSACGSSTSGSHGIVVSSYPAQFLARRVAGAHAEIRDLARPGVEPHDIELTSDDIDAIDNAELVFYIGAGFQPAVATAAKRRGTRAIDIGAGLATRKSDPHFWLDPTLLKNAAARVGAAITKLHPERANAVVKNVSAFAADLERLDLEFKTALAHCERTVFVTTHASFGYLAARYGLTELSISGVTPDTEPSPKRIADLSARIKRDGITTVFYEPRVPRAAADTLAHDAGVKTALLDPYETTAADYFTVMRRNLAALKLALGC
jgi:zinc transport system substrate-binding protein